MARKRFLIIGDGAAGVTAAQTLRAADPKARIAILSDDPHPGYFRAALTNYLLGELREDQLWAVPPNFYQGSGVTRVLCRVVALDPARQQVWEASGAAPIPYDALLVASGARARGADFSGAHLRGVHTMRSIVDVRQIAELLALGSVKAAAVLGGGPLGLEWAHGLHERGVKVQLLERSPRLMGSLLDDVCSDLVTARLRRAGIEVHLGEQVMQAHPNQVGGVAGVSTHSGRTVSCDLVAVAFGVEPNTEFLLSSGMALDPQGHVRTDSAMRTSLPGVWAAGDVASVDGRRFGLWEPAKRQARVAARNMAGGRENFWLSPHYMATRLFDLDFASLGEVHGSTDTEVLLDYPQGTGSISYRKLVLRAGRLVGAQMLGERSTRVRRQGRALGRLIASGADVSSIKTKLLTEEFDIGGWLDTSRLLARPETPRERKLISLSRLKGTQALSLASLAQPPTQAAGNGTLAIGPRQTRMLSIGLHAEGAAPVPVSAPGGAPLDARLEYQGNQWPLTQPVIRLGSAEDAEFRLPGIARLHAEITRHGRQLYLRDMGSRSGTRVNNGLLSVPHALRSGDRIQIEGHLLTFHSSELTERVASTGEAPRALGLEVLSGRSLGLCFALGQGPVLIGSAPHCQLRLSESSVAAQHARITPHAEQYGIVDLGSPAGTRINGALLSPQQTVSLIAETIVSVGAVEIRYGVRPQVQTRFFEPSARLFVDQGQERGKSFSLGAVCLVGSAPECQLVLAGLMPRHLEVQRQGPNYFVRDITGRSLSFRAGTPLGAHFVPLDSGDVLLLNAAVMLRFEEDP